MNIITFNNLCDCQIKVFGDIYVLATLNYHTEDNKKSLANKDYREIGKKYFGELKTTCNFDLAKAPIDSRRDIANIYSREPYNICERAHYKLGVRCHQFLSRDALVFVAVINKWACPCSNHACLNGR